MFLATVSGTPLRTNQFTWLNGVIRTQTDPRGMTRTFDYDLLGRLTTIYQGRLKVLTLPDGTGRTNHYDSIGRLLVVTDAYESRTNSYDNLNRLIATVNGAGLV